MVDLETPLAAHGHNLTPTDEKLDLGAKATPFILGGAVVGVVSIVAAFFLSTGSAEGTRRFYFAYLTAYGSAVAIAIGATFFLLIQHLVRAGWSVNIRRVVESIAATMPVLAVLSIPILFSVAQNDGQLYRWAQPIPEGMGHHGAKGDAHGAKGDDPAAKAAVMDDHAGHDHAPGDHASHAGHDHDAKPAAGTVTDPAQGSGATAIKPADVKGKPYIVADAQPVEELVLGGTSDATDQRSYAHVHPSAFGVAPMDELTASKHAYLNSRFFIIRMIGYFVILSTISLWYWKQSTAQDRDRDIARTGKMAGRAPVAMILYGLSITFLSFDLYMTLDPHWFSTMFGIYFFAGGMQSFFAIMVLLVILLQRMGYLKVVTKEHFHDMGKFMFTWTFFWGYVAFSQFMLIWYASIPEETGWFARRGATTSIQDWTPWTYVAIVLLVGHLLLPFPGLLSRHVKRFKPAIGIWAVWILLFHYLDHFWLVAPELDGVLRFGIVDAAALLGVAGIFVAAIFWNLSRHAVRPVHDPRVNESLAFQNI